MKTIQYLSTFIIYIILSFCLSCATETEFQFQINPREFDKNHFASIPSHEKIYNLFLKSNNDLSEFSNKYKTIANQYSSRDNGASVQITPIILSFSDVNDGFDHSTKQTYFINVKIIALYINYISSHAHGKESPKGFFVVYELICLHSNSEEGATVNAIAKAKLKYFSSSLDANTVPEIENMVKISEDNLIDFKTYKNIKMNNKK
jgi:hypothetical protein